MHLTANDADGFWRDEHGLSSWLQVDFNGAKVLDEVDVFTAADYPAYLTQADPSPTQTFTSFGITAFDVQYWTGSAWATVPGGSITGNNLLWRKITFPAVTTQKIRVMVNAAVDGPPDRGNAAGVGVCFGRIVNRRRKRSAKPA
jgi:hypothetical protein